MPLPRKESARGILSKLFHRETEDETATAPPAACHHANLVPRWTDNPEDMGNEEKATSWDCTGCGASFPPDEARRLQEAEAERVRSLR